MALDRATQLLLRRAKAFRGLVSHPAWPDLKDQLIEDLQPLLDIRNIKDDENVAFRVAVRKEAYKILSNWVNELETKVLQAPIEQEPKDYIFDNEQK
jgi:hypothetical protein